MSATLSTPTPVRAASRYKVNWLGPAALIALAFIPIAGGAVRASALLGGGVVTPSNARFFAAPIPVLAHIVSVTLFSLLGAFQFSDGLRRRWPAWHRAAGHVLFWAGLVAALSGLWMTLFYAIVPADNALLHAIRLVFGGAMALSLVLGLRAILRRNVFEHKAWMRRAYAIGMGAGTQALIQIPHFILLGRPDPMTLAFLMGGAWVLNLAIAEALIRRDRPPARNRSSKTERVRPATI